MVNWLPSKHAQDRDHDVTDLGGHHDRRAGKRRTRRHCHGAEHPGERQCEREEDCPADGAEADGQRKAQTGDAEPRGPESVDEQGARSFHGSRPFRG